MSVGGEVILIYNSARHVTRVKFDHHRNRIVQ
jgi:hypothetical protein